MRNLKNYLVGFFTFFLLSITINLINFYLFKRPIHTGDIIHILPSILIWKSLNLNFTAKNLLYLQNILILPIALIDGFIGLLFGGFYGKNLSTPKIVFWALIFTFLIYEFLICFQFIFIR